MHHLEFINELADSKLKQSQNMFQLLQICNMHTQYQRMPFSHISKNAITAVPLNSHQENYIW